MIGELDGRQESAILIFRRRGAIYTGKIVERRYRGYHGSCRMVKGSIVSLRLLLFAVAVRSVFHAARLTHFRLGETKANLCTVPIF